MIKALKLLPLLLLFAACDKPSSKEAAPEVEYQDPGFKFDIKKIKPKGSECEYVVTFIVSSSFPDRSYAAYGNAVSTVHAEDCSNPAHKR